MHTRHKDYSKSDKKHNTTDTPTIPLQPKTKVTTLMTESDSKISKTVMSKQLDRDKHSDKKAMSDDEVGLLEEEESEMEKKQAVVEKNTDSPKKIVEKKKADPNRNEEVEKKVDPNRNEDPVVKPRKERKKEKVIVQDQSGKEIGFVEFERVGRKRMYVATLDRWTHGVAPRKIPLVELMHGMKHTHPHTQYIFYNHTNAKTNVNIIVYKRPVWT